MVEEKFTGLRYDGHCRRDYPTYNGCWEQELATTVISTAQSLTVGQIYETAGFYRIWRGFVFFDTSSLEGKTIVKATLRLQLDTDQSVTDFDVVIQNGQPDYPHSPMAKADYLHSLYEGDGGHIHTSEIKAGAGFEIELNAKGISWINKTGITKLCLRSSRDIAKISPIHPPSPAREQIYVSSAEDVHKFYPELVVTYQVEKPPDADGANPPTYTIVEVMTNILSALQDTLYYISSAIADNASVIATVIVLGGLSMVIMKYGTRIFKGVGGFFRGLF